MASPFKRGGAANVGAAPVDVLTVPAGKVYVLIDASCANVNPAIAEVKGTLRHVFGGTTINLIKDGPIPVGSSMIVVGAPRKVTLLAGDILRGVSDTANGMDVSVSYLEQDA